MDLFPRGGRDEPGVLTDEEFVDVGERYGGAQFADEVAPVEFAPEPTPAARPEFIDDDMASPEEVAGMAGGPDPFRMHHPLEQVSLADPTTEYAEVRFL
jgi:hypothetical protein